MDLIIPTFHLLGSGCLLTTITFFCLFFSGAFRIKKIEEKVYEELCLKLNVSKEQIYLPEYKNEVIYYISTKYSNEYFNNRLSDFIGSIKIAWVFFSIIITIIIFFFIIWNTYPDNLSNAKNAWWLLLSPIFIFTPTFLLSIFSKLLTGRYPNEASNYRYILKLTHLSQDIPPSWRDLLLYF